MPIQSILDQDLYKLTQQQAVLELYPDAIATYEFINRRPSNKFNEAFLKHLQTQLESVSKLSLAESEYKFLEKTCPYLKIWYLDYLRSYKFNLNELNFSLSNGELKLKICGPWYKTILWEVPLMALISESYFDKVDINWTDKGQKDKLEIKAKIFENNQIKLADFGTRRRRNFTTQELAVKILKNKMSKSLFLGTSNVFLAMIHDLQPIGTLAHEWIMAHSVLSNLLHANKAAFENWAKVYKGKLGIALSDTYGSDAFFADFDGILSRLYDGVRHDSGDPFSFTDKTILHYKKLGINPLFKTIVFSDGLNPEAAVKIKDYCQDKINCVFGIGTNLSNDFDNSPALNIVIKLTAINDFPVVKLSDVPTKASGDETALKIAKWLFLKQGI
jgi:nicotinate phosphoribosyltransferase